MLAFTCLDKLHKTGTCSGQQLEQILALKQTELLLFLVSETLGGTNEDTGEADPHSGTRTGIRNCRDLAADN